MAGGGSDEDNPIPLNVTPLIDVIFCLIVFFMCSLHFKQLEGKIESWLPKDKGVHGTPVSNPVLEEIRVIMSFDRTLGQTVRKVNARPIADDEELGQVLVASNEDFLKLGKTEVPIIIDAEKFVPWRDVINVLNICKKNDLAKIEFAAPIPGQ
jgi:biopolymer transport protein ExbD